MAGRLSYGAGGLVKCNSSSGPDVIGYTFAQTDNGGSSAAPRTIAASGPFSVRVVVVNGAYQDITVISGTITGATVSGRMKATDTSPSGCSATVSFTGTVVFLGVPAKPPAPNKTTPGSGSVRCIVPKLVGRTMAVATKLLAQAHCKLGTVTEPRPKTGATLVVSSSSPTAGTRLPSGTKVNLKLRAA